MKRNKVKWSVILSVVCVILFLAIGQGFAQSLSDILREAENNYKNFNQDFKDMAMVFDAKIYTPEGEMTSEMKLFTKGEKSRSETLIQFPEAEFVGKKKLTDVQAEEQMHYQTGMNWWKFISDKTKYVGIEKIGSRECYLLELEIERESPYKRIWVDKDRLFLVQAEGDSSDGNKVRTTFCVYK
jgi:outer membrane lipoprotein-sorting protein